MAHDAWGLLDNPFRAITQAEGPCRSAVFLVLKCNMNVTIRHALSVRMDIDSRALT